MILVVMKAICMTPPPQKKITHTHINLHTEHTLCHITSKSSLVAIKGLVMHTGG